MAGIGKHNASESCYLTVYHNSTTLKQKLKTKGPLGQIKTLKKLMTVNN
jgi:hypothetical protein